MVKRRSGQVRYRDDIRRAPQIFEQQIFVRTFGVRFGEPPRSGAVHDDRDAMLAVQSRIGIERHADRENVDAEDALAVALNRRNELFVSAPVRSPWPGARPPSLPPRLRVATVGNRVGATGCRPPLAAGTTSRLRQVG